MLQEIVISESCLERTVSYADKGKKQDRLLVISKLFILINGNPLNRFSYRGTTTL